MLDHKCYQVVQEIYHKPGVNRVLERHAQAHTHTHIYYTSMSWQILKQITLNYWNSLFLLRCAFNKLLFNACIYV
jgi:hypothetical protein